MMNSANFFQNDKTMLLFTTSPAGLGHIRVTKALQSGIPENVRSEVMGIKDTGIQFLHRISSRNRILRLIFEFVQNTPGFEGLFAAIYRTSLRVKTDNVYSRIEELVNRRRPKPETLVIVSTHFSLAHKIAKAKAMLAKNLQICVILCVVVTDDSPQKIWGVEGADFIFVPSEKTRTALLEYMTASGMELPEFVVSPYPVSLKLKTLLTNEEFEYRSLQVKAKRKSKINLVIPISGAAVQLNYFRDIISYMDRKKAGEILVVARESKYTKEFLKWCEAIPSVEVVADTFDKDVVGSYERELTGEVFSIEITKPSEQSFKALLTPRQNGGVILLFSNPVGRQEYDNVNFMERYGLLPNYEDQIILHRLYHYNDAEAINHDFLERARSWRGIMLPTKGIVAAKAITRLRKSGILYSMVNFSGFPDNKELRGNGVEVFWRTLEKIASAKCSSMG